MPHQIEKDFYIMKCLKTENKCKKPFKIYPSLAETHHQVQEIKSNSVISRKIPVPKFKIKAIGMIDYRFKIFKRRIIFSGKIESIKNQDMI